MICKRAEVLTYLGLADQSISTVDDARLDMLHPLAESAVKRWLQQHCEFKQHVEYLPASETAWRDESLAYDVEVSNGKVLFSWRDGQQGLQLKHLPVVAHGLSVRVDTGARAGFADDAFAAASELTLGSDYWLDVDAEGVSHTGILYRYSAWPTEPRSIRVSYFAGHDALQLNSDEGGALRLATLITIAKVFRSAVLVDGVPKLSESIGSYSYSTSEQQIQQFLGGGALPAEAISLLQSYRSYAF